MMTIPKDFDSWLDYGNYLANCNDFTGAANAYHRHLEDYPRDYETLYSLGWALFMTERYSEARPYLEDAMTLNPSGDATEYYLAILFCT